MFDFLFGRNSQRQQKPASGFWRIDLRSLGGPITALAREALRLPQKSQKPRREDAARPLPAEQRPRPPHVPQPDDRYDHQQRGYPQPDPQQQDYPQQNYQQHDYQERGYQQPDHPRQNHQPQAHQPRPRQHSPPAANPPATRPPAVRPSPAAARAAGRPRSLPRGARRREELRRTQGGQGREPLRAPRRSGRPAWGRTAPARPRCST